jgi:hypothetical protein
MTEITVHYSLHSYKQTAANPLCFVMYLLSPSCDNFIVMQSCFHNEK